MRYSAFLFAVLGICPTVLLAQKRPLPDKAICAVCALQGETEPEKVKAYTDHQGKAYYFCSDNCKKEFDADPLAYLPPKFPRAAPAFVIASLEGRAVSLKDFENQVVLLDFWATWCKPCQEMMPKLQSLRDSHSGNNFVVLGISIDEGRDSLEQIRKFVDRLKISYPILWDNQATPAWHMLKVKAIPAMFLIDKRGQIVAQWTGKIEHQQVAAEVARLMGEVEKTEGR